MKHAGINRALTRVRFFYCFHLYDQENIGKIKGGLLKCEVCHVGIFFQKRETKSGKIVFVFNIIAALVIFYLLLMAIFNDFNPAYYKAIFLVAGISHTVSGVECYIQKGAKKEYLMDFGTGALFLLMALFWM